MISNRKKISDVYYINMNKFFNIMTIVYTIIIIFCSVFYVVEVGIAESKAISDSKMESFYNQSKKLNMLTDGLIFLSLSICFLLIGIQIIKKLKKDF